eukprot:scaffold42597_cov33-Tisochrysis_lutea.AAC.1
MAAANNDFDIGVRPPCMACERIATGSTESSGRSYVAMAASQGSDGGRWRCPSLGRRYEATRCSTCRPPVSRSRAGLQIPPVSPRTHRAALAERGRGFPRPAQQPYCKVQGRGPVKSDI